MTNPFRNRDVENAPDDPTEAARYYADLAVKYANKAVVWSRISIVFAFLALVIQLAYILTYI